MPPLRSSVLVINHPEPSAVAFGADFASTFTEAQKAIRDFSYPVIALPSSLSTSAQALEFLENVNTLSPLSQRVIIQNDTPADHLRRIINTGAVFRILGSFDDSRFDLTIQEALEEHRLLQQNTKLIQLVNEQNERLKRLTSDLEERVEARRKSLEDAKEKLLATNKRVEALHRALVAIHRAGSIGEMEQLINEALSGALGLSWTRILFQSQARLGEPRGISDSLVSLHSAPLTRGKETLGHIYFAREAQSPFTRDENSFLGQVADAVSLAIDRLTKLEQSESLKHQWEATFDAILEPVSLIESDYTVVRLNRSFAERSGAKPEEIIGRKCYEALFGRTSPCDGCKMSLSLGANFRLKPARTQGGQNAIYDVFSQQVHFKPEDRALFVNMYHDVSAQLRYERQILESAKMAELGTIGSSIAHELNNPLGGMLSFLQLIKMDLKGDEPWYDDIDEMEKGARRCRDIVQSLLGFTRKSSQDTNEIIDLREALQQALKITELQTRAIGINVKHDIPNEAFEMRGQFNALAQALRHFLQNAQDSISEKMRTRAQTPGQLPKRFPGEISIQLRSNEEWHEILISDNGLGLDSQVNDRINETGLGLGVAEQIIKDHGGKLQLASTKDEGTSAKISLPRPVFDP